MERRELANDYIKILAHRTSFSFRSEVVTLDDALTLDLRPAFSLLYWNHQLLDSAVHPVHAKEQQ